MLSLTWGYWEEDWTRGTFRCVFHKAKLEANGDGMAHVIGLYRASDGEMLTDIDTFEMEICRREVIAAGRDGSMRVRAEMADPIAAAIGEWLGKTHNNAKPVLACAH